MKTRPPLVLALWPLVMALAWMIINYLGPQPLSAGKRPLPASTSIGEQPSPTSPTAARLPSTQSHVLNDAMTRQPPVRSNPLDAPGWAVPYGKEFWRQPAARVAIDVKHSSVTNLPATINIGDVIERVRHALAQSETASNPAAEAATYAASFNGKGLTFSPHLPAEASREWNYDWFDLAAVGEICAPRPDPETRFTLRTVGVRRGNKSLYPQAEAPPEWSYVGNTAQAWLNERAGLVEHYELRSDGAHLTWVIGQSPVGSGPVSIEVEAAGLSYAGQTGNGQHFADAHGTARICVGQATAVDASGKTWPLTLTANATGHLSSQHSTLNITIPSAVLAEATYPLAIDPVVGPEFGMDDPLLVPAFGNQEYPSVAANGTNWLVVWDDDRRQAYWIVDRDIYGARVNESGVVLDSSGIAISTAVDDEVAPSVAANGTDWLIVWQDTRNWNSSGWDIYGTRVNAAGVVMDTNGIAISAGPSYQWGSKTAANGTNWLVVWEDTRGGNDIYGARVDGGGMVLDGEGFVICKATNNQYSPSVAANGTDWLVAWEDYRSGTNYDIYGTRVDGSGVLLDGDGFVICAATNNQYSPSVSANGTNWLVVWEDNRNSVHGTDYWDIYGARVNGSGVVLDSSGIFVSAASNFQAYPSVAANGIEWLVVWRDSRSGSNSVIYGTRVDGAGVVLDSGGFPICTESNHQDFPSVAAIGTNWLVVWQDLRNGYSDAEICGTRVNGSGLVLDGGIAVGTAANFQEHPTVAANGTDWLVVWQDHRYGSFVTEIYGTRVNGSGVVLDSSGIAICTATNSPWEFPSVAANGTDWLVVWRDGRRGALSDDIYGARVNGSGVVLDSNGIAICDAINDPSHPAVAANGTDWLVVWQDNRRGWRYDDMWGTRVDRAGVVLDTNGIPIHTGTYNNTEFSYSVPPSVAANRTNWLVVWPNRGGGSWDIYGARVDGAGVVLDTNGIAISTASSRQYSPSVAANGTDWLVVWTDARSSSYDIYGARVNGSGVVLDGGGIAISTVGGFYEYSPSVAADGTNWLVVWEDDRNWDSKGLDIYGASVNGGGLVLDATGFAINVSSGDQRHPAVAELNGQHLVVYDGPIETGDQRIRAQILSAPLTQVTTTNDSGPGSLRQAILNANANLGLDTVTFNIPGTAPHTITLSSPLPQITDPVIIDGPTQPGFSGKPVIELNGMNAGPWAWGLDITAGNSTVRGLVINRFSADGIHLSESGGNVIQGNFIGTDASGTNALGNTASGIHVYNSPNNLIGGTTPGAGNVLSGNGYGSPGNADGLNLNLNGASNNVVQGNLIGTDSTGTKPLPNARAGIVIWHAANNTIGGSAAGAGNVISGNLDNGIIINEADTHDNLVQGNLIGTDVSGTKALGNGNAGIGISAGAFANTIGGSSTAARNVISGNRNHGVAVSGANTTSNLVQGNFIGTDASGTARLGNATNGISIRLGASGNWIGGLVSGAGNLISGNGRTGVSVSSAGTTGNVIAGNLIGTDVTGALALGNTTYGVILTTGSSTTTIGGSQSAARNVISGNDNIGVFINNSANNMVQGNFIGINAATNALGNLGSGVYVSLGTNNLIGGTNFGEANVIGNNLAGASSAGDGVTIASGLGNSVLGNAVYANVARGIALGTNGLVLNDAGDGDTGPNGMQNFPVLISAASTSGNTFIQGTLNSTADTWFTLEFFSDPSCDAGGFGEGQVFVGRTSALTDGSGNVAFNVTFMPAVVAARVITATATDSAGNTSAFSACATVVSVTSPTITNQPQSVTVTNGSPASFSVTAIGTEPLVYQWQKNDTNLVNDPHISGATSNVLTLGEATTNDAGSYRVIVANSYGSATSSVAVLTVTAAPVLNDADHYVWTTIAGTVSAWGTSDGTNSGARFYHTAGIDVGEDGSLVAVDSSAHTVRRLTPIGTNWVVTTIAGQAGQSGTNDGLFTNRFFAPRGIVWLNASNILVADGWNNTLRQLLLTGTNWMVKTIAGDAQYAGGWIDGTNNGARFNDPHRFALDRQGNLYVPDYNTAVIRKITPSGTNWVVSTIAGSPGQPGSADGTNATARFNCPAAIAIDDTGILYVADRANHAIRKIAPVGSNWVVTTIVGQGGISGSLDGTNSNARFYSPEDVEIDRNGNLYVTDAGNNTVRKLRRIGNDWVVSTIGGLAGSLGSADGINSAARFYIPIAITVDAAGVLYVADTYNFTVRKGVPMFLNLPLAFQAVELSNSTIAFCWNAVPGRIYQVQYSTNLAQPDWINLTNALTSTNFSMSASDLIGPDQQRFYRVKAGP